jgi:hypothetical protein
MTYQVGISRSDIYNILLHAVLTQNHQVPPHLGTGNPVEDTAPISLGVHEPTFSQDAELLAHDGLNLALTRLDDIVHALRASHCIQEVQNAGAMRISQQTQEAGRLLQLIEGN